MLLFAALTLAVSIHGTFADSKDLSATAVVVSFKEKTSKPASEPATFNILEQSWDQLPDEEKENVVRVRTTATVTDLRKRIYNITCSSLGALGDVGNNKSCTEMIIVGEFQDDGNNHVLDFVLLNGSHAIKSDDIVGRAEVWNNLSTTMRLDWVDISKAEFPSPFSAKVYTFIGIILAVALTVFLIFSVDVFRRRRRNRTTENPISDGDPHVVQIGFVDLPIHTPPRSFELKTDGSPPRFNERL